MPLPFAIARINKRFLNRMIEPIVRRTDGFAVVHHNGRRSGAAYTTPIKAFALDDDVVVSLSYGPGADWAQNVLAGGGSVEDASGRHTIRSSLVIDRTEAWPALSPTVRLGLRVMRVRQFLRISFDHRR